jgi:hypothetical protein
MEPTLMQKLKDVLAKVDYEAVNEGPAIVLAFGLKGLSVNLTLIPDDNKRLAFGVSFEGYTKGKL